MAATRTARRDFAVSVTMTMMLTGLFAVLAAMVPLAAGPESQAGPAVSVTEENGIYSVFARFRVSEPPARVAEVLTDYAHIPQFMPQIKISNVIERGPGRAVVEQEAESKLLTFSKRMHLVLEITEDEGLLRFRDRCGRSFDRYEGVWHLVEHNGGTEVTYELTAQPGFGVPQFILSRLLKRDSARMIAQLKNRMANQKR
jgi:carbon monoxide dehydrogenase subunit G